MTLSVGTEELLEVDASDSAFKKQKQISKLILYSF